MEDHSTPELYCPECGYDLRGGITGRCPECGLELDEKTLRQPRIPWVHRSKIGPFRAYRRTVDMVMIHPGRVGGEVGKPISAADARAFRRVTVWLATLPVIALAATWYAVVFGPIDQWRGRLSFASALFEWLTLVAVAAGAGIFFHAMTAVAGFFFRPAALSPERQSRAVAVSYYAAAPLAWFSVLLPLAAFGGWVLARWPDLWRYPLAGWAAWAAVVLPGLILIWACIVTLAILKRATNCGIGREVAVAVLLPIIWAILAALLLVGIPATVAYLGLAVLSLL